MTLTLTFCPISYFLPVLSPIPSIEQLTAQAPYSQATVALATAL